MGDRDLSPGGHHACALQVMDKNDNAPQFVFPSRRNSTVHLSSYAPQGHVVTHVTAHDLDAPLSRSHAGQVEVAGSLSTTMMPISSS